MGRWAVPWACMLHSVLDEWSTLLHSGPVRLVLHETQQGHFGMELATNPVQTTPTTGLACLLRLRAQIYGRERHAATGRKFGRREVVA